jgi:divalent metal cation (Fe/Co/Zn/Cd) transporter
MGDLLAALVVMFFIGMTAYRVLREGLAVIVDASLLEALAVQTLVESIEAVHSCHYVRSRGMRGHVHLDLHVTLDPQMSLEQAGEVMIYIKERLRAQFPDLRDILIQIEPHHPRHYEDVPEQLL